MALAIGCSLLVSQRYANVNNKISSVIASGTLNFLPNKIISATFGQPDVSVPVLSKTTVVIELMRSNTSPPLIRTPKFAATPVPTITAVGVARPNAQGHAITKVEIPNVNAKKNLD